MMHRKVAARTLAAGALALSLGIAACGGDDEGGGDGGQGDGQQANVRFDMTIGDLVPLSGDLSVFGPPGQKAADLAVEQINQAAQQAGVQTNVNVRHADTETQAQAGVQAARQLISGGANCLTGAWASAVTTAVAESVTSRQQVPTISPASTSPDLTGLEDNGFLFRTAPSDTLQAPALADAVEQQLGGTDFTLSLAARNDSYGEGFVEQFSQAWEEKGGQIAGPVLYDPEQPSFNSEAQEIVSGDPDTYVIIDFPETFARVGPALIRTGNYDPEKLFTADGLAGDEIPEAVPTEALQGARGTRPGTALADQFSQLWTSAGGPQRQTFDSQNFDAVMLCYLAAVAAGSSDGMAIQQELQNVSAPPGNQYNYTQLAEAIQALARGEDIDFEGASGPINFDDNGDPTAVVYDIWQYNDQGQLEVRDTVPARQGG